MQTNLSSSYEYTKRLQTTAKNCAGFYFLLFHEGTLNERVRVVGSQTNVRDVREDTEAACIEQEQAGGNTARCTK